MGWGGVRVKREKPCKASGDRGSVGACTRRESGLTSRSQSNRQLPGGPSKRCAGCKLKGHGGGVGWGGCNEQ